MIRIYTLLWIGLFALAVLNGAIREIFYKEALGELAAHQLSTLTGCLLFFREHPQFLTKPFQNQKMYPEPDFLACS
ncbi:MAG: hypothetical protein HWN68_00015 [Desulfobacterales bacterium]|nr:hypothetical protein [Desulfobacterales bacterium]